MIRMVQNAKGFPEAEIVGKYALRDQGLQWASLGRPVIVTGVSGGRAYVDEERGKWDDDIKEWRLNGEGERSAAGHISLSTVRCICDTAAEVNAVLTMSRIADKEFRDLLARAKARLAAMDGIPSDHAALAAKP